MFGSRLYSQVWRVSRNAVSRRAPGPRFNGKRLSPIQARIPLGSIVYLTAASLGALYLGQEVLKAASPPKNLPPLPVPVPALDLDSATEKLRIEESTTYFDAGDGRQGQVFRIRVQSNAPTEDEYVHDTADGQGGQPLSFWGVLDGHAGWATSAVLRQTLIPYVAAYLSYLPATAAVSDLILSIKRAFTALDGSIMYDALSALSAPPSSPSAISAIAPAISGSCALLSIYNPATSLLLTACVGDSRAVLGRASPSQTDSTSAPSYAAHPLSEDQTGRNAAEYDRITALHPNEPDCVDRTSGRVLGLAVTRAFGDSRWKWPTATQKIAQERFFAQAPRPKAQMPPAYLTAEPEVTSTQVGAGDFLVLGTDGLWDHMSSQDAVRCVALWREEVGRGKLEPARPGLRGEYAPAEVGGGENRYELEAGSYAVWKAEEKDFVVEDGNAATHLVRNALGGRRRGLFTGVMSTYAPLSRSVRDDITVFVVFFGDVQGNP